MLKLEIFLARSGNGDAFDVDALARQARMESYHRPSLQWRETSRFPRLRVGRLVDG